jgi:hypothetical protein
MISFPFPVLLNSLVCLITLDDTRGISIGGSISGITTRI